MDKLSANVQCLILRMFFDNLYLLSNCFQLHFMKVSINTFNESLAFSGSKTPVFNHLQQKFKRANSLSNKHVKTLIQVMRNLFCFKVEILLIFVKILQKLDFSTF